MKNLLPRAFYVFSLVTSRIKVDIPILLKSFLANFIEKKYWMFEKNVSEEKAIILPR